jgi:hypothetical protein
MLEPALILRRASPEKVVLLRRRSEVGRSGIACHDVAATLISSSSLSVGKKGSGTVISVGRYHRLSRDREV